MNAIKELRQLENFEQDFKLQEVQHTPELTQLVHLMGLQKLVNMEQQAQIVDSIMSITRKVITRPSNLENDKFSGIWQPLLERWQERAIPRAKAPNVTLDCSVALEMLKTGQLPEITYKKVNLTDPTAHEEAAKTHWEIVQEFFPKRNTVPLQFVKNLLADPAAECYLAKIGQKCVAIFWGYHYKVNGSSQFYVHLLGRKGCAATLGAGEKITEIAFRELFKNKNVEYITLDVDQDNERAINFYKNHQFVLLSDKLNENGQYTFAKSNSAVASPLPTVEEVEKGIEPLVQTALNLKISLELAIAELAWSTLYK